MSNAPRFTSTGEPVTLIETYRVGNPAGEGWFFIQINGKVYTLPQADALRLASEITAHVAGMTD